MQPESSPTAWKEKLATVPRRMVVTEASHAELVLEADAEGLDTCNLVESWMKEYHCKSFLVIHRTGGARLLNLSSEKGFESFARLFDSH